MNSERENKHKQLLKKRDLCIYRSELTATKMDANEILMMVRVEAKFRSQMRNMYTPSRSTNGYDLLPGIWHTESKSIRTNTYKHASNTHTHTLKHVLLYFSATFKWHYNGTVDGTKARYILCVCARIFMFWWCGINFYWRKPLKSQQRSILSSPFSFSLSFIPILETFGRIFFVLVSSIFRLLFKI